MSAQAQNRSRGVADQATAPQCSGLPEADAVAIEHVLWCASEGFTARQVLAAADIHWPASGEPDWHDCARGLAIAWRRLNVLGMRARIASVRIVRRAA